MEKRVEPKEFLEMLSDVKIKSERIKAVEEKYHCTLLDETVCRILSVNDTEYVFEGDTWMYALSLEEIIDADRLLQADFSSKKIFPVIDKGDNDFICFDYKNEDWICFNIVDEVIFKRMTSLREYIK